jgi:hypothetical protein
MHAVRTQPLSLIKTNTAESCESVSQVTERRSPTQPFGKLNSFRETVRQSHCTNIKIISQYMWELKRPETGREPAPETFFLPSIYLWQRTVSIIAQLWSRALSDYALLSVEVELASGNRYSLYIHGIQSGRWECDLPERKQGKRRKNQPGHHSNMQTTSLLFILLAGRM